MHVHAWIIPLDFMLCQKETKASLTTYKEKMAQAYDFALDKMGLDIQSFSLWSDYIKFLKVRVWNATHISNWFSSGCRCGW